jgi:hypothetical protein
MLLRLYTQVSSVFRHMLLVFYLDVAYAANGYVASVCFKCYICFRYMLQLFHLSVAKIDLDMLVWRKLKPSVVQLLRLPGVAKMEFADTRTVGTEWHGGLAGMWSGNERGPPCCVRRAQAWEAPSGRTLSLEQGNGAGHVLGTGGVSGRPSASRSVLTILNFISLLYNHSKL